MTPQTLLPVLVLAMAVGAPLSAAQALSVTGLTVAPNTGNTVNENVITGQTRVHVGSSTSVVSSSPGPVADLVGAMVSFETRYAAITAVDREATSSNATRTQTSNYKITFTVNNPIGGDYRIDIDTRRLGALTLVDDSTTGTGASASLSAVAGLLDGLLNATLGLAAVPTLSGASGGNTAFNQSTSTLTILDSAVTKTYTLDFSWTATATSTQDEAAVRLGIAGTIVPATADDYPGVGSRTAANDGHFADVKVTLLTIPEPGTAALLGLGLVLVATGARARGRS